MAEEQKPKRVEALIRALSRPDEELSPRGVLQELVITFIILALFIAAGRVLFTFSMPPIVLLILGVIELTLLLRAANGFLRVAPATINLVQQIAIAFRDAVSNVLGHKEGRRISVIIHHETSNRKVEVTVKTDKADLEVQQEVIKLLIDAAVRQLDREKQDGSNDNSRSARD